MSSPSNPNQSPKLRFHWACALPVIAIVAMLFRDTTVMQIMTVVVFLLIAMGAALVTWFVGRRKPRSGSLGFFCVMTIAAIWVAHQQNLAATWAQTAVLQQKLDNFMNTRLGTPHKESQAKSGTQRTEAGSH